MTLAPRKDSKRSLKRAKTGITKSRCQRRAERRLLQKKQGYENIMNWRKSHLVSDSKPCLPGAAKHH